MPNVLVTRPRHQQQGFIEQCHALKIDTLSLPLIKIQPLSVDPELWQPQHDKTKVAWIFTSFNAVNYCPFKQTPTGPVFAMGASTARKLRQHGHTPAVEPQTPFNSEALLEQLQNRDIEHAVIVTGRGGRAWLGEHLAKLGWKVTKLDCYQRIAESHEPQFVIDTLQAVDILSLTSIESMDALLHLVNIATVEKIANTGADFNAVWQNKPLVVNSERAVTEARNAGFTGSIHVAVPAGDDGQITAIKNILA